MVDSQIATTRSTISHRWYYDAIKKTLSTCFFRILILL